MKISIREKLLLTGLLIAALAYFTFTFIISPNIEEKDVLETQRSSLEIQVEKLNNTAEEADLNESIEEQYSIVDEIAINYFNTTKQEELILLSNDLFEVDDMIASEISYSKPEIQLVGEKEFLSTTLNINFEGEYSSLMNILDSVWAYPKFMQVESLDLTAIEVVTELEEDELLNTEVIETVVEDALVNNEEQETNEEAVYEDVGTAETLEEPIVEPIVTMVNGNLSIKLMYVLVESNVVDDLYTWYIDQQFTKENPFAEYEEANSTIRYIYTGQGAYLFNFDRFKEFTDIKGHPMEDEIQDFLEQGYIYKNNYNTFNPDQAITRGEFVVLLDSVYDWTGEVEENIDITQFDDYDDLGSLEDSFAKAIQKGIQRGYIKGYSDNTLGLNEPITYNEIELVMQRIQRDEGFSWDEVAKSIVINKSITSDRWNDKELGVSKAEAVYLLTYFK